MCEELITEATRKMVKDGSLAGAVTLVWQNGRVMQAAGIGWRDMASRLPMERDTLLRIASITKPITSTAALMLSLEVWH